MHKLKAITPLGAKNPRVDTVGAITITEVVDQALASVAARQGQEKALRRALQKHHDLVLPDVGASSRAGDLLAFWLGPEQWMLSAPYDSHELLAAELKLTVGKSASVVEQTDGWCCFRTMDKGAVVRSIIEHSGAFVRCLRPGERFALMSPRSSASSLHHGLLTAATSIA